MASIVEQYNKKSKGPQRQPLSISKSAEFCSSSEPEGHRPVVSMPILTHWNGHPQNGLSQNGLGDEEEEDLEGMTLGFNEKRPAPKHVAIQICS